MRAGLCYPSVGLFAYSLVLDVRRLRLNALSSTWSSTGVSWAAAAVCICRCRLNESPLCLYLCHIEHYAYFYKHSMTPLFSPFASQHHNVTNHPPPPLFLFLCPPFFSPLQSVSVFIPLFSIPLSPSSFPLPPTLTYTFLLLLLSSSSSGRFLLHDQPLFGSRVWGGGRPVLLLGHNLRWSHVHPGSCRDPSGELLCLLCCCSS